jgi:PAS domain S-box-containing protein
MGIPSWIPVIRPEARGYSADVDVSGSCHHLLLIRQEASLTTRAHRAGGGFFKTLFDQSPYAMQIFSPDGIVVKTNDAWESFWGVPRSETVNTYNIFKDRQAQKVGLTSAFKQAKAGVSTTLHDICYEPPRARLGGEARFLNVRMLPLEQSEGEVEGIVCILEDNTPLKNAESARRSYQERLEREVDTRTRDLEALLQFSTELTAVDDLATLYTFITSWAKSLLRFDYSTLFILSRKSGQLVMEATIGFPHSMVGSFVLLKDHGLPSLVARERQPAMVNDFRKEDRFYIPDVIFEHGLVSSLAVPMFNKNELIGVLIGHTRKKRCFTDSDVSLYQSFANQAAVAIASTMYLRSLQRSEERFRHLFERANDAIYLVDLESRKIVDCNRRALLLDGYTYEELTSMNMFDLYPQEELNDLEERHRQIIAEGSCTTVRTNHHVRKDGSLVPVEISASLVDIGDRKLILNIVRDVSRRKALEKEQEATAARLRRASRMEAIGLMAGGVAHDLNNILSGIISYPELLMMRLPAENPIRDDLQKIVESGQRAAGVVADLLTVARGAATVKEVVCLNDLVSRYMSSPEFCKLKSLHPEIDFVSEYARKLKNVHCSPIHLQKVLLNLATNAAESIEGRGEVRISTAMHRQDEPYADIPLGLSVVLKVQDTGSGISREDQEHIFDPFYTTKKMGRSGTGLGLAVVWNTMLDHDGTVTVDSSERGTVFTLYLPVSEDAQTCSISSSGCSLTGLRGRGTILVVDDEEVQREIAVKILTAVGYKVTAVAGGEEAVAFTRRNRVDLLLLDMVMEPGIGGRETYERIARFRPGQKAVIVSGYSASEDIERLKELGVRRLLKKPYTMQELAGIIQEAMGD